MEEIRFSRIVVEIANVKVGSVGNAIPDCFSGLAIVCILCRKSDSNKTSGGPSPYSERSSVIAISVC